jgi:hypothetical protein
LGKDELRIAFIAALILAASQKLLAAELGITVGMGAGISTCAEFAKDYSGNPDYVEREYFAWAQGYMTGLNSVLEHARDLDKLTIQSQRAWIRLYCDRHPLLMYKTAVEDLFEGLKSPKR